MHELLLEMHNQSEKKSFLHSIDTRVMLIFVLIVIFYAVLCDSVTKLLILWFVILILFGFAKLSPKYVLKRLALIFPFGGFLALMQPLIREGVVIYSFGIFNVTQEGLDFGILLLLRLFVTVSSVILLSSTSSMTTIFNAMKRLHFPKFLVAILHMMIRYLFIFYENIHDISIAQKSRGFTVRKNKQGYRFVLKNFGNILSSLFIKSYDQGERVYTSMLSRGYSLDSDYIFDKDRRVRARDFSPVFGMVILFLFLELYHLWQI